ncbi:hypothetical protein CRE_05925 [Caenorhabditis remanei]|uniref:Uncharacterized protein n=1 Tax=Caenorhabditis remanei TaxID=31234 RepID=E3MZB1_CAERE|nr:hypothetical protein CRE_05925 [Caenorhabditis remanei]
MEALKEPKIEIEEEKIAGDVVVKVEEPEFRVPVNPHSAGSDSEHAKKVKKYKKKQAKKHRKEKAKKHSNRERVGNNSPAPASDSSDEDKGTSSEANSRPQPFIFAPIPLVYPQNIVMYENCYYKEAKKVFPNRLHERGENERWTAFFRRLYLEKINAPPAYETRSHKAKAAVQAGGVSQVVGEESSGERFVDKELPYMFIVDVAGPAPPPAPSGPVMVERGCSPIIDPSEEIAALSVAAREAASSQAGTSSSSGDTTNKSFQYL